MPNYCCVPNCESNSGLEPELKFYPYPKNENGAKWEKAITKGTGSLITEKGRRQVCEKHFKPEDFVPNKQINGSILMIRKANAIPSVFNSDSLISRKPKVPFPNNSPLSKGNSLNYHELETPENEKLSLNEELQLKCRICLKNQGAVFFNEFLPQTKVTVTEALKKTFGLTLQDNILFPQKLCIRCFNYLTTAHWLKMAAFKSEATLKSLASKNPQATTVKEEDSPSPLTILKATDKNAVFIIKELSDNQEMPVNIKEEPEEMIQDNQACSMMIKIPSEIISERGNALTKNVEPKNKNPHKPPARFNKEQLDKEYQQYLEQIKKNRKTTGGKRKKVESDEEEGNFDSENDSSRDEPVIKTLRKSPDPENCERRKSLRNGKIS